MGVRSLFTPRVVLDLVFVGLCVAGCSGASSGPDSPTPTIECVAPTSAVMTWLKPIWPVVPASVGQICKEVATLLS